MTDDPSRNNSEAEARLAAAYLDMWEGIASAHALKGPSLDGHTAGRAADGEGRSDKAGRERDGHD